MNRDRSLGAGLVGFAVAGIAVTMQISVRTFNDDPGPKLFPLFGFAILILCGLGLLLTGKSPVEKSDDPAEGGARFVRGAIMSGLFVLYALALWLVGFYIATPLMVYAFYHVIAGGGRRVPWQGIVYSIAVTGSVHLIFARFLHKLLPPGILF